MSKGLSDQLRKTTSPQFTADWERQRRTAADILERLQSQEGVILADQVGMGKTYVALAVAVSEILSTRELGQVVVFVPPAVATKWVNEWKKFSETLVESGSGIRCVKHPIRSGEDFLKALDDPPQLRNHLVVVTHTALTSSLKDSLIQLALLYYATKGTHGADALRERIARWSNGRQGIILNKKFTPDIVAKLLNTSPAKWREAWLKLTNEELPDDPVPAALEVAARSTDFGTLRSVIKGLPVNSSADIKNRLKRASEALVEVTQTVWKTLLSSTNLDLPLLIVDEAHRLKNSGTQISKLFASCSDDQMAGVFHGTFRRMLFLTATPFELGHTELISVLSRFGAVSQPINPPLAKRLDVLQDVLTAAQISALSFDRAWGGLKLADLPVFDIWESDAAAPNSLSAAAREAWVHANLAVQTRRKMHDRLKRWVIRHERPHRRDYLAGAAITGNEETGGLPIPEEAALPFLLAARAQSIMLDDKKPTRPLFAYGIASSYETFCRLGSGADDDGIDTDNQKEDQGDDDPSKRVHSTTSDTVCWYRREIDSILTSSTKKDEHPKVRATVDKAEKLWLQGEKCLIFNWFIRSGKVIKEALSDRIDTLISNIAKEALHEDNPNQALDRISDRLFRSDSSSYARIRERLTEALEEAAGDYNDVLDLVVDTGIRHLRTASYLVRYTPLKPDINDEEVWSGVQGNNPCNIVLLDRWKIFTEQLAKARKQIEAVNLTDERGSEFGRIRTALLGTHSENGAVSQGGAKLHPVRRAYGGTGRHVRERLIALFNTPFAPELLVASSVMGEGIDLHQACRVVIHHDLDWNPSILEQRTGRLDRIGALAERTGRNIEVYEPYLAGTHDEKMYKVVKDRGQWFDIVMGRSANADEHITDADEIRVPLHQKIKKALAMDLRSD